MTKIMILQGREVNDTDIELIRFLMIVHPTWGRTPLSVELCRRWNWCLSACLPERVRSQTGGTHRQAKLRVGSRISACAYTQTGGGSHTVAEAGADGSHPTTAVSETFTECF